jgi:molybdopterin molybdotransferase
MDLLTVQQAQQIILSHTLDLGVETVPFMESLGRVLKEEIKADRDFPPFNRISMDGIAINATHFNQGQRTFKIEGVQAAGTAQLTLKNSANCLEAMTGAVLPKNTDTIVPYEQVIIENDIATVTAETVRAFQNIHEKGLDRAQGDVLIPKNTRISPAEIGVLATVGETVVKVAQLPKVMVVSTGNELVEVGEIPANHQIRRSNVFTVVALLQNFQIAANTTHIADDKETLLTEISALLKQYDVLIFSGAVSKGKFDFIPEVLETLGVQKLFHKVKQRPGKPFWFGKKNEKVIFAFPGNPVSTFVSCVKYFFPWYLKSVGLDFSQKDFAVLSQDYVFNPSLTYFLQVKVHIENGVLVATPITGKGSGDLANLLDADGFLELPYDRTNFTKGEVFPLLQFRK